MVILHLSDIHFGRDNPKYSVEGEFRKKKEILQDLLVSIGDNAIKPDHIIVTGDIAWFGKKEDFDEALEWFKRLLKVTNLSGSNITFCPGNHDVKRTYGNYKTSLNYKEVKALDQVYQYEYVHRMESPLYNYDKFCEAMGVVPYHYPKADNWEASYAIGYKDISLVSGEVFRVVSFNTALLSFIQGYPDDQMLIGQPQIMELLMYSLIGSDRKHYTIALFHHAERYLHTYEICEYDYRNATLPLLRRYVDLVLCGHTETGGIPVLYKQKDGAEMLTGGAAYYSDDHANAYSMIIVPDSMPGEEREICLLPYTYSIDNGWHQNKRTVLPDIRCTITAKQPDFNCKSDFECVLSYDDQTMSIPMKCVSVFTGENNIATLSNSEDVCRNLDIVCSGPTDKPGLSNVSIKIASTKETSVEALLARQNTFGFLSRAKKAKNGSAFEIIDASGNIYLSGQNISYNGDIEGEGIDFLTKLRKIEIEYDVLFHCPKDNTESMKVDVLNDLIEQGYTTAFRAIPRIETYSTDKKQLFKIGLLALKNRSIYILHKGVFQCQLYGNDFSLGNATVLMGPYTTKGNWAMCKAITYTEGDQRRIKFNLCNNSVCYIITDEKKADIAKLLKDKGQYIQVGYIDCAWDFIYEVHPQTKSN